jgi:hypothetical protein
MKYAASLAIGCLLMAGCSDESPTTPSTTPPSVAAPSVTETWENTLAAGGRRFYSFSVGQNGTVNVTLASLLENNADSSAQLGLGIGSPVATGCSANTSATYSVGSDPQISTVYAPGIYCVQVADPGNLGSAGKFRILIAHP